MKQGTYAFSWGSAETEYFFKLTPERILDGVERLGFACTGRCLALNSMENRVYEVEIDLPDLKQIKSPSDRFKIVKFYRPGRWTKEQILEEHKFLLDLEEYEIPVVAPLKSDNGETIHQLPNLDIWYAVFPKIGGRSPDELDHEQLERVGRLLARMHNVGATSPAPSRIELNERTYGFSSIQFLKESNTIPQDLESRYLKLGDEICVRTAPLFEGVLKLRVHGDCHFGNLLWGKDGPFWVDFDDMVRAPAIQDLWLIIPSRDDYGKAQLEILIDAYSTMRDFNREELRLIEALRALRIIHFDAWIAKRWDDPAFPRTFQQFGTPRYWSEQIATLSEQLELIRES